MIAVWMLYCLGIGLAFSVAGYALERGLHYAGRPTRGAWVIALVGSYVIPVASWVRPQAFSTFAAPGSTGVDYAANSSTTTSTVASNPTQRSPTPFSLTSLDAPLRWGWGLASFALVLTLGIAARRLLALRRRWRRTAVEGRDVLISPNVGPAVVGLWSPQVVLPEWALHLPGGELELMLAHEEQHMRARDPTLIAGGFLLVLLAPWNIALWWQWRRLRLAVEIDCDTRVLAHGRSAPAYGELLIRVGERRSPRLLGVAAFGEPASFLESRIRRMVASLPRWRWLGAAVAAFLAIGAIVAACEAPRPFVPRAMAQEPATDRSSAPQTSWVRDNVRQFFPTLSDPNGPALDAYLIHDAQLRVYQATVRQRGRDAIVIPDLKRVFPAYNREHDGWGVFDGSMLQGIVRENVRVIWLHHDPQPQDTMPSLEDTFETLRGQAQRLMEEQPFAVRAGQDIVSTLEADSSTRLQLQQRLGEELERVRWQRRDESVRRLAQQSEPAAFAGARDAIVLVIDQDNGLVAHASGTREPSDRSCVDVLTRLLPAYRSTRFPLSGCMNADNQGRVVIYWGQLEKD